MERVLCPSWLCVQNKYDLLSLLLLLLLPKALFVCDLLAQPSSKDDRSEKMLSEKYKTKTTFEERRTYPNMSTTVLAGRSGRPERVWRIWGELEIIMLDLDNYFQTYEVPFPNNALSSRIVTALAGQAWKSGWRACDSTRYDFEKKEVSIHGPGTSRQLLPY